MQVKSGVLVRFLLQNLIRKVDVHRPLLGADRHVFLLRHLGNFDASHGGFKLAQAAKTLQVHVELQLCYIAGIMQADCAIAAPRQDRAVWLDEALAQEFLLVGLEEQYLLKSVTV